MKEKNMRWGCKCTDRHACDYHKRVSLYRGYDDYGTLPIEYERIKELLD